MQKFQLHISHADGAGQVGTLFVRLLGKNSTVQDRRNLFYKIYKQGARSYNSENIKFPVISGFSSTIEAGLDGPTNDRIVGTVQSFGFYIVECH